jgi:hypothetical protein
MSSRYLIMHPHALLRQTTCGATKAQLQQPGGAKLVEDSLPEVGLRILVPPRAA